MPVGVNHQDGTADAGLEILLGGVPVEVSLEKGLGLFHEPVVYGADGDDVVFASLTEWTVDQEEGMRMPVTLSLPRASVARAATTAESRPPERPSTARDIPA